MPPGPVLLAVECDLNESSVETGTDNVVFWMVLVLDRTREDKVDTSPVSLDLPADADGVGERNEPILRDGPSELETKAALDESGSNKNTEQDLSSIIASYPWYSSDS